MLAANRATKEDDDLVKKLLNVEEGLTDWEIKFAESLGAQVFNERRTLSGPQRKKANEILERLGL